MPVVVDLGTQSVEEEKPYRGPFRIVAVLLALVVVVALAVAAAAFALSFTVSGPSMHPTLGSGDRILTNPFSSSVRRFDVVALTEPGTNARIVKRVVGMPGDQVQIKPQGNGSAQVFVRPIGGSWSLVVQQTWIGNWGTSTVSCCSLDGKGSQQPSAATVPSGEYFVVGDNPALSVDSRQFGWVKASAIVGPVLMRVWPLNEFGALPDKPALILSGNGG